MKNAYIFQLNPDLVSFCDHESCISATFMDIPTYIRMYIHVQFIYYIFIPPLCAWYA